MDRQADREREESYFIGCFPTNIEHPTNDTSSSLHVNSTPNKSREVKFLIAASKNPEPSSKN